ncbi:MAG: rhodanese-like domain-containing protein [Flavobacteriales bacterium AspAUS03]
MLKFFPQLVKIIRQPDTALLDVRESLELFRDGRIERAIHIPMASVPHYLEEIRAMKRSFVVFCKKGGRSAKVQEYLVQQGIKEVYNGGGYENIKSILEYSI